MLLRHSSRGKSLGMALLQELIETIVGALRTQHTARMRCVGTWTLLKLFTCTIGTAFKHQLSRDAVLLFVQKGGLACLLDVMAAWPKDLVLQRNGCCLLHVTAKQIDMHRIARTSELERLLVRVVCRCQESTNTFPRDKAVLHHGNCVVRCLSAFKGSLRCPDWAWKTSLRAGAHVDAQDEEELAWFEAVVVETQWVTPGGVDESKDCLAGTAASSANSVFMVKVHFLGWEEKWDQWINVTEHPDRIQRRNFMIASWRPLLRQVSVGEWHCIYLAVIEQTRCVNECFHACGECEISCIFYIPCGNNYRCRYKYARTDAYSERSLAFKRNPLACRVTWWKSKSPSEGCTATCTESCSWTAPLAAASRVRWGNGTRVASSASWSRMPRTDVSRGDCGRS